MRKYQHFGVDILAPNSLDAAKMNIACSNNYQVNHKPHTAKARLFQDRNN
jgi:hypothetical protein